MKIWIKRALIASLAVMAALAAVWVWLAWVPHTPPSLPVTINVPPGTTLKRLAVELERHGVVADAGRFVLVTRLLGRGHGLRAGVYTLDRPLSVPALLDKFERGEVSLVPIQFIEGWSLKDVRAALAREPLLRQDSAALDEAALARAIGADEPRLEGLLFPDTYFFAPHTSDLDILRRAYRLQKQKLEAAWQTRMPGLPYATSYEALIMASIIEKETGAPHERPLIAGVFVNRLRIGMRLQTDPTVIYGMGEAYEGNIRRSDLMRDTPYNTYTRAGLPPTPIAMPGEAAIRAALNPAATPALYFVSRNDGTHVFSRTLEEHNRAVNQYQRSRRTP